MELSQSLLYMMRGVNIDFKNDGKYISKKRKDYCYKNTLDNLTNEIPIIDKNFKEKYLNKSKNYLLKSKEISNFIDKFVHNLKNDEEKYKFYELLEMKKSLHIFEHMQHYINGYKKAVHLMVEAYGNEYEVKDIKDKDIGSVQDYE